MSYYDYPIKCQECGLHYTVHSWDGDWYGITESEDDRSTTGGGFCPECGTKGKKMLFKQRGDDRQIFEVVPGDQPPVEITALVQYGVGHGAPTVKRMEEGA